MRGIPLVPALSIVVLLSTAQAAIPGATTRLTALPPHGSACVNTGDACRCSKATAAGARLCKRPIGDGLCRVDLCDEPWACDCAGNFFCEQVATPTYWDCDKAGSAVFRASDTCACSRRKTSTARFGLRVVQTFAEFSKRTTVHNGGICDWPLDFWA